MLPPTIAANDKKAIRMITGFSIVVFLAISYLSKVKLDVNLGFDKHLFATANAIINTLVSLLLLAALYFVKAKNYSLHKKLMLAAMVLSVLFLVSYICHHLFTGDTKYGDLDHNGTLDEAEKTAAGSIRYFYYFIISTHILLAGIVMPFVLFTAYRGLTAEFGKHKKIARITWPIWLYVAVTGPVVYWMIKPYYSN